MLTTSKEKFFSSTAPLMEYGVKNKVKRVGHSHPEDTKKDIYAISGDDKQTITDISHDIKNKKSPGSFMNTKYYMQRKGERKRNPYNNKAKD